MEVKVSFDREKLEKWFNEDCGIECEDCPLEGWVLKHEGENNCNLVNKQHIVS